MELPYETLDEPQILHSAFLEVSNNIISLFCQWVRSGGDFDHHPIFLELKGSSGKPGSPFKYNPSWLQEESYSHLVKQYWRPFNPKLGSSIAHQFMDNLKMPKKATIH